MTDTTGFTGSVTTAGGGDTYNDNTEGKTTPRKFNVDQDARAMESGGTYPNYWSHKTRSGHSFIMDDSQGNETVTIQHRSGTAIQMRPDGGMLLTTHNGKYEVVLGEERVTISGASDITVKGDTSLRCYGDYNVTVHKDYNLTVLGNMNMTAKNVNKSIRGTIDTEAKTINTKSEGPILYNTQDSYGVSAKNNITNTGGGAGQYVFGGDFSSKSLSGNHISYSGKNTYRQADGELHETAQSSSTLSAHRYGVSSGGGNHVYSKKVTKSKVEYKITNADHSTNIDKNKNLNVGGSRTTKVTGGDNSLSVTQGDIQSQSNNIKHNAQQAYQVTAGSNMDLRAPSGQAVFAGASTVINALSGALGIAGSSGISLDSLGSMLNLNGGIASIVSALGLQLNFNFTDATNADTVPDVKGKSASQPNAEPDATGEIDSWQ